MLVQAVLGKRFRRSSQFTVRRVTISPAGVLAGAAAKTTSFGCSDSRFATQLRSLLDVLGSV